MEALNWSNSYLEVRALYDNCAVTVYAPDRVPEQLRVAIDCLPPLPPVEGESVSKYNIGYCLACGCAVGLLAVGV